jgi:hypothetical protein
MNSKSKLAKKVKVLTSIRGVHVSNFGLETIYPNWGNWWFFAAPAGVSQRSVALSNATTDSFSVTFNPFYYWLSCLTKNVMRIRYRLDVVYENNHFVLWEIYGLLKYILWHSKVLPSALACGTFIYRLVWRVKFY